MRPRGAEPLADPLTIPGWDAMVARFPECTAFHRAGWLASLAHTYGHSPACVLAGAPDDPDAAMPFLSVRSPLTGARGVCLPFTDFCGPLLRDAARAAAFWDDVREAGRDAGWRRVEWRGPAWVAGATPSVTYLAHRLDLRPGAEALWRGFGGSVRQAVRKAEAAGIAIRFGAAPADVAAFYRLHGLTRRRHGLPPPPKRFFDEIAGRVLRPGGGFIALACPPGGDGGGRPVAAAVFLHHGRRAVFKFGASDERSQATRPNNLVMWHAIRRCLELGIEELHLGRTDAQQEGLRRFKLGWGAREEPLAYYRFRLADGRWLSARSRAHGWHTRVFRLLPAALNRWAGALLYRHLD